MPPTLGNFTWKSLKYDQIEMCGTYRKRSPQGTHETRFRLERLVIRYLGCVYEYFPYAVKIISLQSWYNSVLNLSNLGVLKDYYEIYIMRCTHHEIRIGPDHMDMLEDWPDIFNRLTLRIEIFNRKWLLKSMEIVKIHDYATELGSFLLMATGTSNDGDIRGGKDGWSYWKPVEYSNSSKTLINIPRVIYQNIEIRYCRMMERLYSTTSLKCNL